MEAGRPQQPIVSAWAPFRSPPFRVLWAGAFLCNVAIWTHEVGAGWLMTLLAPDPVMVSLVQATMSLPIFLFALPAGALADVVDRRLLLMAAQAWACIASALLGALTLAELTSPWMLLAFTFAISMGTGLLNPVWQSVIPNVVPRADLLPAVSLYSVAINFARTIGPAVGGLIMAAGGAGGIFLFTAAALAGVVLLLLSWRIPARESPLPPEPVGNAIRAGLRYVRHDRRVIAILVRSGSFILFGSVLWALLPLMARTRIGLGAAAYGTLVAFIGLGAVCGAAVLPRLRQRLTADRLVTGAEMLYAVALMLLIFASSFPAACAILFAAGAAWLTLLSSFNASVASAVPAWVRGRALALAILTFFGGMALGSAAWGRIAASAAGISGALISAAVGLLLSLVLLRRFRIPQSEGLNLEPSSYFSHPHAVASREAQDGTVVVTVQYRIDPVQAQEFVRAMGELRRIRCRDGARRWNLLRSADDPSIYVECFELDSWIDHLRFHERITHADRVYLDQARGFHVGATPPAVAHFFVT